MPQTRLTERRLGDAMRRHLPASVSELIMFVFKQAWACLFGACLLAAITWTKVIWQDD